jgi:hypothetical protein
MSVLPIGKTLYLQCCQQLDIENDFLALKKLEKSESMEPQAILLVAVARRCVFIATASTEI